MNIGVRDLIVIFVLKHHIHYMMYRYYSFYKNSGRLYMLLLLHHHSSLDYIDIQVMRLCYLHRQCNWQQFLHKFYTDIHKLHNNMYLQHHNIYLDSYNCHHYLQFHYEIYEHQIYHRLSILFLLSLSKLYNCNDMIGKMLHYYQNIVRCKDRCCRWVGILFCLMNCMMYIGLRCCCMSHSYSDSLVLDKRLLLYSFIRIHLCSNSC